MFFKRKSNILFRNYGSFGYITDNRNFRYKLVDNQKNDIGDKILSESGAVFMSVLGSEAQSIDNLVKKLYKHFKTVDIGVLKKDALDFYEMLERDGFIVSAETRVDCEYIDKKNTYKESEPQIVKEEFLPSTLHSEDSTQIFFEAYYKGRPQLTNLHLEITSKCNERCLHCYIPHENKVSDIDPALFYDILKQCKKMKLLHLTLSGGEPMLHSNFCDFLRKCREYNFSVNVLSNLTLLNDDIIKEMKRNPLLSVQVSLYSMSSSIHDEITQVAGSFDKTINAIIKLIDNDIPMQISCPILKQNKNSYVDVKNWADKHKIHVGDDYTIIARYNHSTQNLSNRLSINEIKEVINNIVISDKDYLAKIEREASEKKNTSDNDFVCSVCHSSICIAENGTVYPCAGWQDNILGNVKQNTLKDIWNNSEKVRYLRDLRRQDFPKCILCPDKDFCTMCMVRNANEDPLGNPLNVNEFFCDIAKLNRIMISDWKQKQCD